MMEQKEKTIKIAMYDLEGNLLEVIESKSIAQIERDLNIPKSALYSCVKGWHLSTIDRQFREVPNGKRALNRIGNIANVTTCYLRPVMKLYNNRYICSYSSISEAVAITGIDGANITRCCNNKRDLAGGFGWKFI